jgi:hypothetical protein
MRKANGEKTMKCMVFSALFSVALTMALYHIGYANSVWDISTFFEPIAWKEQKGRIDTEMVIDPSRQLTGGIYPRLPTDFNPNSLYGADGVFPPPDSDTIKFSLNALLEAYNVPFPVAILLVGSGMIGFVGAHRK